MNTVVNPRLEPEDLLRLPDGERYELIDGQLRETHMGARSEEIGGLLLTLFNNFIRPRGLGHAYPSKTGYQCFPGRPNTVRMPDVSFIAKGRLPNDESPDGHIQIAPDLAVEVVSPNDLYEEVEAKVNEYLAAGVKLVWVVSPGSRTVLIRRPDDTCALVRESGELSGEGVIPGFTCKVAELFV